ncbi:MAG: outer membrane protein assembly factor BamA [Acidobacteria bacterium]|nr:MAG: outer membrane protein assembly factor BamA [Acidobacteriota bacterium]
MKVQVLILVLLVPSWLDAEQQYYGTRIASLTLSGAESQADLPLLPIRSGEIITAENIRLSIQALYNTGHYSYVEVDATPAANGETNLDFRVRSNFFFSTIRLEPENILERPLSGYFRLPYGEKFTTSTVDALVRETAEMLKAEGYFEATITPKNQLDEASHLAFVTLSVTPGNKARVGIVRVQGGLQTFSQKELLDAFNFKGGDEYSASRAEKGIANIRTKFSDLGFLNTKVTESRMYQQSTNTVDIDIMIEPGQFTLVETPGFKISKKKLRELVPVFEEGSVDEDLVEEGRVQILRYMQQEGYFEGVVGKELIPAPLDNAIQINYAIEPGVKHEILAVAIEGNHHFSTEAIRVRMKVRKAQLLNPSFFSAEALNEDVRTIETMYRNAGFEGTIVKGNYAEVNHGVNITIEIQEGKQLPIDSIVIVGNSAVSEQELHKAIQLKEGDLYTPVVVDQARAAVTQYYYTRGYADARVERTVTRDESNHGMRVTFVITEGDPYQIGRIFVEGNTLTKDKIIHRNSGLYPNIPYNPEAVLEGQQRLYATGLFSRVDIVTLTESEPHIRDLLIQLEDAKPILLTYGIGYQEWASVRGTIEISHNNLWGLDRSLSFRVRGSFRERLAQSTFREPRLFNHDLDGFASAFLEHTERLDFKANRLDFSLQTLKRFPPTQNLLFTMGYQTVDLLDVRVNPLANILKGEIGIFQIARVGTSYIQDRRNDPLNPSTGSFHTTTFQVASHVLGSELDFTSLYNLYSMYTPVPHGVLATSVRLGWNHPFGNTTSLPPTERYFAGGSTTLRGFSFDDARPGGGYAMAIANFEYRTPLRILPIKGLGTALFYDTGNVFPTVSDIHLSEFTHTAGFGLRYQTPLGPVRIDLGINLNPKLRARTQEEYFREDRFKVFFTLANPF